MAQAQRFLMKTELTGIFYIIENYSYQINLEVSKP
jgi:hypothetical protein